MAVSLEINEHNQEISKILVQSIQSCNLNFLIGSGCSYPAISVLGNIEKEIEELIKANKSKEATKEVEDFYNAIFDSFEILKENSTQTLLKMDTEKEILDLSDLEKHALTMKYYDYFMSAISNILFERKNNIIHKQATIFSTNYDLFIEKVMEKYSESVILNDGFMRVPAIDSKYHFSTRNFFNKVYNTGNLYKYQVELPSINLLKIHGSLNWKVENNQIVQDYGRLKKSNKQNNNIINSLSIILPKKDKFHDTVINQNYYDLLRLFSNELDKENTLLISEGFSFADEHLLEIIKRALKNPTLRLVIFCYNHNELKKLEDEFAPFLNVNIIYSKTENIDFAKFNDSLINILPPKDEIPTYNMIIKGKVNE